MPRKYVNKGLRHKIDPEVLAKAIEEVQSGLDLRKVAENRGINKSSLHRYVQKTKTKANDNGNENEETTSAKEVAKSMSLALGAKPVQCHSHDQTQYDQMFCLQAAIPLEMRNFQQLFRLRYV